MGNSESRFREAVRNGDHIKAYELFYNKKVIRDNIDPNEPCDHHDKSSRSILHYTAFHAMQPLYEEFLENRRVSPLITDKYQYTCLHLICAVGKDNDIRYNMLQTTLSNPFLKDPVSLSRALASRALAGNTPLHLACFSGLEKCVELLINAGADATLTNEEGQTPVDMASEAKHNAIAEKLETKIVFSEDDKLVIELDPEPVLFPQTTYTGMKNQELQSMKDQLVIETSELLGISLFTAEALLRRYEWSKETLLEAWMNDPAGTCDGAGVQLPAILSIDNIDQSLLLDKNHAEDIVCNICYLPTKESIVVPCKHTFCKDCWQQYLHEKIKNAQIHTIVCPEYACYKLVPIEIIEKIVSRDMANKYLQFDIKAFVDSNPNICWCPHPGCNQAIQKPAFLDDIQTSATDVKGTVVHCDFNHYFCWDCRETAHEPCTCSEWKRWLNKIEQMSEKIGDVYLDCHNEAASSQWISSNSKPCPNCKSAIEKLDGCNHMKCSKCHHDFCWMCLDPWSKHSSATGGYYDCNRYKAIEKVDEMLEKRKAESEEIKQVSYFLHYYNRYKNHCHSLQLETDYLKSADEKMLNLRYNALQEGTMASSVLFVKEAMTSLVEARYTIAASYGYGYSIMIVCKRDNFERVQGSFEEQVEALAEVVARPHLRKSKQEIVRLTNTVIKEKQMFVDFVHKEENLSCPSLPRLPTDKYIKLRNERFEREQKEVQTREEEEQLQQALQISKEQYDEDSQLKSDTDFAILLSMYTERKKPSSPVHSLNSTNDVNIVYPSVSQNDNSLDSSSMKNDNSLDSSSIKNNFYLESWRQTLLHEDRWATSSPSSNSNTTPERDFVFQNETNEYGPLYGEDEDLATAIALSLSTVSVKGNDSSTGNNQ